MEQVIQVLDTIALMEDLPQKGLGRGQVGTVVEQLGPDAFEVEFVGTNGETYAMLPLRTEQIMVLRHTPVYAAQSS